LHGVRESWGALSFLIHHGRDRVGYLIQCLSNLETTPKIQPQLRRTRAFCNSADPGRDWRTPHPADITLPGPHESLSLPHMLFAATACLFLSFCRAQI